MPNQHTRHSIEDRLRNRLTEGPGGCWLYRGATAGKTGYAQLTLAAPDRERFGVARNAYAHRIAYQLWIGPIPEGMEVDHACEVRLCCNPAHLQLLPKAKNCSGGSKHYAQRSTCNYGHPLEGENVRYRSNGARICVACKRQRQRAYDARRRNKNRTEAEK